MNRSVITREAQNALTMQAGGTYSQSGVVSQHTLWDSALFVTTTMPGLTTFFTTPIGGAYGAGVKTRAETNLQDSGKLPNGQQFLIKEMAVSAKFNMGLASRPNQGADDLINSFWTIMENSFFQIKFAGREFDVEINGSEFCPINKMVGLSASTQPTMRLQGDTIMSGWYRLKATPQVISQLVSFNVLHQCSSVALQARINTASHTLFNQGAEYKILLRGILTKNI